jgi:hypothetical protein
MRLKVTPSMQGLNCAYACPVHAEELYYDFFL